MLVFLMVRNKGYKMAKFKYIIKRSKKKIEPNGRIIYFTDIIKTNSLIKLQSLKQNYQCLGNKIIIVDYTIERLANNG